MSANQDDEPTRPMPDEEVERELQEAMIEGAHIATARECVARIMALHIDPANPDGVPDEEVAVAIMKAGVMMAVTVAHQYGMADQFEDMLKRFTRMTEDVATVVEEMKKGMN